MIPVAAPTIITTTEFESHRDVKSTSVSRRRAGRRSKIPCPACGGSAPAFFNRGHCGHIVGRRCNECSLEFKTQRINGKEQILTAPLSPPEPHPWSERPEEEKSPGINTFLDLHWLLVSTDRLTRKQSTAALQALERAKQKCGVIENASFKPFSKAEKKILNQ